MKKSKELKPGDKLIYIGRGFLSFDSNHVDMEFVEKVSGYPHDLRVKYMKTGDTLVVMEHEVKLPE